MATALSDSDRLVPFHHLFAFRVSVQYSGLFDTGGDRIAHVDVDHHSVSFLYREVVKKTVPIGEVDTIYANKRQAMQLVLVEKGGTETSSKNTIWFMNQSELDLFHAVVVDLKEGRHPGNRVKVPLLRQATVMKRNRTGFFNIKHATLMPGKMVVTRSKGNCPPEDVVALRDAALGLDEKKGYITIGAAGRTSVWKGLNNEDTFKWHDALLSALALGTATAKGAAGKRQSGNGKPPPRLSMVYGDELSSDRVFKARESVFAPGDQLDTDSEDELYHGEESPLPDELLAKSKQGRDLPETEDLLPSPRDSSSPAPLSGVIKAAVGTVFDKMKQNRERERALSTMTQLPDDLAWRQDEILPSDDGSDAGSTGSADAAGGTQQMKRWSAEETGLGAQKQGSPKKGHHRTASAPPRAAQGSLLLSTSPVPTSPIKRPSLQDIPEHQPLESDAIPREAHAASVRFPDQGTDNAAIISQVLESPASSPNSTPRALDSPTSTPRQGESVIEHRVSDNNVLSNMLAPLSPAAPSAAAQVPTKERIAVPRLSLPTTAAPRPAEPPSPAKELEVRLPAVATQSPVEPVSKQYSIEMPSTPPLLGSRQAFQQDDAWIQPQPTSPQPPERGGNVVVAAAGVVPSGSPAQHTQGLHFKAPDGPGPEQRDSLAFDGGYWSSSVPQVTAVAQQVSKPVATAVDPISPKELGSMMLYKTKLQAVISELRGTLENVPQEKIDKNSLLSKLSTIDRTLAAVPQDDQGAAPGGAHTQTSTGVFQQLVGSTVQGAPQPALNLDQQPAGGMPGSFADAGKLSAAPAGSAPVLATGMPRMEVTPYPARKVELVADSPAQSRSQSPEPVLDMLASQMEQQSVQLMHQVAMAVASMPEQSGQQPEGTACVRPESVSVQGAPPVEVPASVAAGTTGPVGAWPAFDQQDTQPASSDCIVNPLFKGLQVEQPEPAFGSLVTRIRATELRLQEAILSLTEATQRFKQELPTTVPFAQGSVVGACDSSMLPTRPATQPHACSMCQTPQPPRGRVSWNGDVTNPVVAEGVCAPLCRLGWTPLNPLYPVSSRSVSPPSHAQSPRRSPSPKKVVPQPPAYKVPTYEPAKAAQDSPSSSPGQYDEEAAKQQSRRERESMFLPMNPVNLPMKPKASLHAAAAMARASRIQSQLAQIHAEPPESLTAAAMTRASKIQSHLAQMHSEAPEPVRETSRSSLVRPPNLPVGRPSAVGSLLSESSTWSLEQSTLEDDLLACHVPEEATERLSLGPQGLRDHYRPKSSKVDARQLNKAAKTRGSMRVSIHPQAAVSRESEVEGSVSEPGESDDSGTSGKPLWLEEKKAQRVSYHEATIFALRQAGIHVEPHWFGPVEPATENANAETRGSADVICRAARSVAQGASDLETFLLKRFPLAMPVENNWQSDPTTYSTAEAVDVLDKDPRKSVAVKNEKRQGILYNSPAASGPSMRMRSKAASCMPSLQAGGSALSALPATLQAALAFESPNTMARGSIATAQHPSAAEKAPEPSPSDKQQKHSDLAGLLASLDRQEITEEQFLEGLGDLQEIQADHAGSNPVEEPGSTEAQDNLETEQLETVYGDAVDCT